MKVTLLPSSTSPGGERNQYLTTWLIDDAVAIDAGSLGLHGLPEDQARIKHVFLTHTHIDHIASLPVFVENIFEVGHEPVTVHATQPVLDCLRRDIFNDRVWPDFFRLGGPDRPFLKLAVLEPNRAVEVEGLRFLPVAVNHIVPTVGLIVEAPDGSIVIASDTGPTDEIWALANASPNLKAVFLESAFPDELGWLAEVSKHLTPELLAGEARKIRPGTPIFAVHIKPKYEAQIAAELHALGLDSVKICRPGHTYTF